MRRPFKEELDQLNREAPRQFELALGLKEAQVGGGDDWLAIAYLLEEIDYLESQLREQCIATGQPYCTMLGRRSIAEMGEVALEYILKKYPAAI